MTVVQSTKEQCARTLNWFQDKCLRDFRLLTQSVWAMRSTVLLRSE